MCSLEGLYLQLCPFFLKILLAIQDLLWFHIYFRIICCRCEKCHEYFDRNYTAAAVAAAKSLQSCPTVLPHRRQPARLPRPWDSPGKSTGVGCHFLLQCMKVKSESEVAQSCPTLSEPVDCRLPGSSVHGILQARVLEWGAIAFSKELH